MIHQQLASKLGLNSWTDWMGVGASVACAIHCALMPFVGMFLPMLGLSFLMDESFHIVMVFVCSALAIAAFIPGFRRHRRLLPICVGVVGLSLISTAAFAIESSCCANCASAISSETTEGSAEAGAECCTEACCVSENLVAAGSTLAVQADEPTSDSILQSLIPWITPLGGLLLVGAHLTNRRFSCRCGCCPTVTGANVVDC